MSLRLVCLPLCALPVLAACSETAPNATSVASRGPGPSYACLQPQLSRAGLRERTQATPDGWWMQIEVLGGPPTGWYDKGRIEYAGGTLTYIPNSATQGIADDTVGRTLLPLLQDCGDGESRR